MSGSSMDLLSKSVASSALSLRFYLFWLIFWFFFFYWLHLSFSPAPDALIFSDDKWTGGLISAKGGRMPLTHVAAAAAAALAVAQVDTVAREKRRIETSQQANLQLTHNVEQQIPPGTRAATPMSNNDNENFYILPPDFSEESVLDETPRKRRYVIDLVLVLGSGRSGTSASSRSLQVFDFWVPNTVKASKDNPKGYFEDTQMIAFNDKVLKYLRYKYVGRETQSGPIPNTPQMFTELPYVVEALGILQSNLAMGIQQRNRTETEEDLCMPNESSRSMKNGEAYEDCVIGRIGLKDPRMTRLLPFWRYIITLFQMNFLSCDFSSEAPCVILRPRFVLSIRNPAAYHDSLIRASPSMAAMADSVVFHWLISYVIALFDTTPSERTLLHYGELTSKTSQVLNSLAKFLQIPLTPRIHDKRQQFAKEFIDESLNHHRNSSDDVRILEKRYNVSGLSALYRGLTGGEGQLKNLHLDTPPFDVNRLLLDFSQINTQTLLNDPTFQKDKQKWQNSLNAFLKEWSDQPHSTSTIQTDTQMDDQIARHTEIR